MRIIPTNEGVRMSGVANAQAAQIARQQIDTLLGTAERAGMETERLQHLLGLSPSDWQQWLGVLHDAPMPSRPALPLLLRHMGWLTSRLDRKARSAYA
jgi:hypothetical protein